MRRSFSVDLSLILRPIFSVTSSLSLERKSAAVLTDPALCARLELKVTEKIRLKIWEDIQTTPIEVTTSSSDVADEEQIFFTQADKIVESE